MNAVTELIEKDVYVTPGKYYDRLVNLNSELGGGIQIHEVTNDSITTEDLITQVAQGKIPYTVTDNDLAKLNKTYYSNLDISLPVSFDQRSSWAVRKDSPKLAAAATKWHQENMTSPAYTASMKRYFENSKMMSHSPILSLKEGKISRQEAVWSMEEHRMWNYLGMNGFHEIELCSRPIQLKPKDTVFMATSGIFEELSWSEMEDILAGPGSLQERADAMICAAERKESVQKENGSVIIF